MGEELLRGLLVIIAQSGHFVEHFVEIKRGLAVVDVYCILRGIVIDGVTSLRIASKAFMAYSFDDGFY
jgi:hypothetical protein